MYMPEHAIGDVVVIPRHHGSGSGKVGRICDIRTTDVGVFYLVDVSTSAIYEKIRVLACALDEQQRG